MSEQEQKLIRIQAWDDAQREDRDPIKRPWTADYFRILAANSDQKEPSLESRGATGRLYGGYTREMLPEVHPKMHDIFAQAGKAIQASIVGFDLIIERPTEDPDTQKWGIIEANSLPFIDLHYFALEGTPIDIAKPIWDLWEKHYKKA